MRIQPILALPLSFLLSLPCSGQEHFPPIQEGQPIEGVPLGEVHPPIVGEPLPGIVEGGCGSEGCSGGCASCARTVEQLKIHLVEEQEATTQHKLDIREQVVEVATKNTLKVDFYEEKRFVTEMKFVPYEEIQEVIATKVIEEPCYDCHGHPIKKFVTVPCVKQVKLTKYHQVPVTREVLVKVPCLKCVPKQVLVKKIVALPVEVAAIRTTLRGVPVHNCIDVPNCPPSFAHVISPMPVPYIEPGPIEMPVKPETPSGTPGELHQPRPKTLPGF